MNCAALGLNDSYVYFQAEDGSFMIADVCTDGKPSQECDVTYSDGTFCQYIYDLNAPLGGGTYFGNYTCNPPVDGRTSTIANLICW